MWGITMYLMRLADYLQGPKGKKTCRICNYIAKNENALITICKRNMTYKIKTVN
jgi:hypothetical protein